MRWFAWTFGYYANKTRILKRICHSVRTPLHPGILNIPVGTPNYEAMRLTSEHKESLSLTREANNVEGCLLKQLGKLLPELYLQLFRNQYSNTFNADLQTILLYLFTNYGYITPEELGDQKEALAPKVSILNSPLSSCLMNLTSCSKLQYLHLNPTPIHKSLILE